MTKIIYNNMTGLTYSTENYKEFKETGNKNIFEDVIDKMILEEVAGMNETFRNAISSLPKRDKRMAILSILDKDRNLFKSIKSLINDNKLSKIEHLKDVIYKIREYVKVGEVEQKKFGEVMSDFDKVVKPMINELPDEYWTNPNLKILDNCNGTGPFPLLVIWKLMNGLKEIIKNEEERYKHIVENMIYVAELQPRNQFIWMCIVDPYDEYDLNVYTGSFLEAGFDNHMKEVWNVDRFQLILGNPPYQDELKTKKGSAKPLYNLFTEKSIKMCDQLLYITPSRWFAGGKGLDSFRKMMIESNKIKYIRHFDDATELFGDSVDITGGVSYFLIDNKYNGICDFDGHSVNLSKYDIIVNPKYYSIVDKVSEMNGLDKICKGQSYSGITTNDSRLVSEKINDDYIKCYVSKVNGYEKWIHITEIRDSIDILKWKVITARANGVYRKFGNKFIGHPNEVCNQSYICFEINSEIESKNLLKYIDTKFANFLLSIRKISQDLKPDTCKWIPKIDLSREWTDLELSILFNLSEDEKKIIGI